MDGHGSGNKQVVKSDRHQQLLVLVIVLTVFCVSLCVIRFVNAKSSDKKMKLNIKSVTLTVGNSQKLKVRNLLDTAKVTWKSSNKSVASVSKKGSVKAKKKGKATIKCKITYGRKSNKTRTLPVKGGNRLKKNYVGKHFKNYDSFLVLSHFKGHTMAGFGGAIKNISIGIASSKGKSYIHSGGTSTSGFDGDQNGFLEAMAEAGKAVFDSLGNGKNIVYVNVMNNLSVDCDCDGYPAKPKMKDIGILASTDPVALDQACVDLVYKQKKGDGASLVKRIESRNGLRTLKHAEEIGLGNRAYKIVNVD